MRLRWLGGLVSLVSLLSLTVWFGAGWATYWYKNYNVAESGPLGDTFGVSNSLFACLAFIGVVFSLFFQRAWQQKADRLQEKSLLLQAYVFLAEHNESEARHWADLSDRVGQGNPLYERYGTRWSMYRGGVQTCRNRIIELMKELGEVVPAGAFPTMPD
jgi:hypothetical protein